MRRYKILAALAGVIFIAVCLRWICDTNRENRQIMQDVHDSHMRQIGAIKERTRQHAVESDEIQKRLDAEKEQSR